ncbi:MAG: Na(+)-translocating NADH-quinone reductase subunit C [Flavobacteriaceae bacterium]
MALNTEKNLYTVLFSALMVIAVGSVLAFVASGLSGKIAENERFEKQQNILYAMGVNENEDEGTVNFIPTDRVETEFKKYITEQWVYEGSDKTENEEAYLIDLKKEIAASKNGATPRLPVFIGEKDGKKYHILPMYGKGLWDAIWGFMALDEDLVIQGIYFDHKQETPGLGANIKQRYFMDDFTGESILDGSQFAGVSVAKGNNDPLNLRKDDNAVDALAGATITGNGVSDMISDSMTLYKNYLETLREN